MYWRSSRGTSATIRRDETMNSTIVAANIPETMSSSMMKCPLGSVRRTLDVDRHNLLDQESADHLHDHNHSHDHPAPPRGHQRLHRIVFHEPQDEPEKQRQRAHDPPLKLALRGQRADLSFHDRLGA